jgi:hypothetical protein
MRFSLLGCCFGEPPLSTEYSVLSTQYSEAIRKAENPVETRR